MFARKLNGKLLITALLILVLGIAALPVNGTAGVAPPTQGVKLSPIGSPTWKPVDFHVFSAPVGTAESGYVEFNETMQAILPPPNHVWIDGLGIGPGAAHQPPYTSELAAGVAAQGYHQGVQFSTGEFSEGMGVWVVWMNVPAPGVTGSSPDFTSGPIIPNSLFPIHQEGNDYHNGAFFSFLGGFDVPALTQFGFDVDGSSHFPVFFADNADFGPPGAKLNGEYRYVITEVDASGNGWKIEAHFTVAP
ncbi:MAG TPA: hypothetical protein VF831_09715 [Anaerolineales bacterium]